MTIIVKNKTTFDTVQISNVTNIAYNTSTKIYTITAGSTTTYSSDNYFISILIL